MKFNELLDRGYQAIKKHRKLITKTTKRSDFLKKIREELYEAEHEDFMLRTGNGKTERYIEELTDVVTTCFNQMIDLGYDPITEYEKVVIKNETRND